jgi:Tfp pilus assembly protein PilX
MLKNNKGVALVLVMSVVLALLILGSTAGLISTGHFGTSFAQIRRARAYHTAEAAIHHAFWSLRTGAYALPPPGGSTVIPFPEEMNGIPPANITITVEDENTSGQNPEGTYPVVVHIDY